ncbi:MAG: PilZ domain-containing protein [Panacagrimonas sp.]
MNAVHDPFGGLPRFSERARVGFEASASVRDETTLARCEEEAVAVLQTLLALEEQGAPRKDEEHESSAEFQRLERKLDLVIELLSARLMADTALPERMVQFSAAGARWAGSAVDAMPKPGTVGVFSVSLHRVLPRPLLMPAEVMADEPGWLRVGFLRMGDACEDLLVRYVFLQHRRKLAGARRLKQG